MKRYLLLIVVLFATAFSSFAQIEDEIQQSKKEKIAKGRAYLLEKFIERDYEKVREIKDYLMEMDDDNYVALTPFEQWHILLWTKEYDALTETLRHSDSVYFASYEKKVFPEQDDLMRRLYYRSAEDEHLLRFSLNEAQLPEEDRAFLTLFLDWLVRSENNDNQDNWNAEADKFLAGYPNSEYEWFVRHWIRKQYVENDWGWGMGLDVCGGFLTGSLKDKFLPIFGFGISFDVLYKKFLLNLGYDIIISDTKIDQPYSGGIYPAGSRDNVMNFYADLGYRIVDNRAISVIPFVGIGGAWDLHDLSGGFDI